MIGLARFWRPPGWADPSRIAASLGLFAGAPANAEFSGDIALFTLDELRFSGAGDPIAALVLCGAHRADRVMIAGTWRVVDGMPAGIDVAALRQAHGLDARAFL